MLRTLDIEHIILFTQVMDAVLEGLCLQVCSLACIVKKKGR